MGPEPIVLPLYYPPVAGIEIYQLSLESQGETVMEQSALRMAQNVKFEARNSKSETNPNDRNNKFETNGIAHGAKR